MERRRGPRRAQGSRRPQGRERRGLALVAVEAPRALPSGPRKRRSLAQELDHVRDSRRTEGHTPGEGWWWRHQLGIPVAAAAAAALWKLLRPLPTKQPYKVMARKRQIYYYCCCCCCQLDGSSGQRFALHEQRGRDGSAPSPLKKQGVA